MDRTPPPRGASRAGVSGFRPVPKVTLGQRVRGAITPLRLAFVAVAAVGAAVGSFFLDTAFPESLEGTGDPGARLAGRQAAEKMAQVAGGADTVRAIGVVNAHVEDTWSGLFASLSPWTSAESRFDLSTRPDRDAYRARMVFSSGVTWGYDGEIWIDGGDVTGTPIRRARLYTRELPRLLLAPFAPIIEDATTELLAPGLLSVRFRDPGRPSITTEWRFYLDQATGRLQAIALPFSGADPSPLSVCTVSGWTRLGGIEVPEGYDCVMSNRAQIALHRMRFTGVTISEPSPKQFAAPKLGTTIDAERAR